MSHSKENPAGGNQRGALLRNLNLNNKAVSQRQRLLEFLQCYGRISTLEARAKLNVLHPAARVFELRQRGVKILTFWRTDVTPEGYEHRVANYLLSQSAE
jgi:hypothetical protein